MGLIEGEEVYLITKISVQPITGHHADLTDDEVIYCCCYYYYYIIITIITIIIIIIIIILRNIIM